MRNRCRNARTAELTARILVFCTAFTLYGHSAAAEEPAAAEDGGEDVQRIEIRAAGEKDAAAAPSSQVTVITREEIKAAAPRELAQLIAPSLGIQILRYGGTAQGAFVSIRGASPEQVVVLIDGVPANPVQGGGTDLSSINLDDVERIEIFRGGNSSAFGENALGGAVNIVTRKAAKERVKSEGFFSLGSFNTAAAGATVTGARPDELDFSANLNVFHSGGAYTYVDDHEDETPTRENADSDSLSASARVNFYPAAGLIIRTGLQAANEDRGAPGLLEFPTETARIRDQNIAGSVSFEYELPNVILSGTSGASYAYRNYTDAENYLGPVDDTHRNIGLRAGAKAETAFGLARYTVRPGLSYDYRYDFLDSSALLDSAGVTDSSATVFRHQHSVYLRTDFEPEGKHLFIPFIYPSARIDINTVRGLSETKTDTPVSWAIGAVVPLVPDDRLSFKGNVSYSHRVPSFSDLFWPSTAFAVGNPDLDIEKGFMWDAGLEGNPLPWLKLSGAYFRQNIDDLILWTPGAGGRWRPDNVGSALIQGAEAQTSILFDLPGLDSVLEGTANMTYLHPENKTEGTAAYGKILPRRAQLLANAQFTITRYAGHSAKIEAQYVGPRYSNRANTKTIGAYTLINGSVSAVLSGHCTMRLTGQNLFNLRFVDLNEYPVPGFSFTFETRVEL